MRQVIELAQRFTNKVNKDEWRGHSPRTVLLQITGGSVSEDGCLVEVWGHKVKPYLEVLDIDWELDVKRFEIYEGDDFTTIDQLEREYKERQNVPG